MAYTAEVLSKEIVNGLLKVEVRYTEGAVTFVDRHETRQPQDLVWLNDLIKARLDALNGLATFAGTIPLGAFVPTTVVLPDPTDPREIYKAKLEKFEKLVAAIRKGLIAEDETNFAALKLWLKNNFQQSYWDLF